MRSRSIVMRKIGGPDVLVMEDVERAALVAGEIRLRTLAAAVNHSDLEIRAGNWNIRRTPQFPYVPGLEVIGEVVETAPDVSSVKIGDRVWTMMQGFGGVRAERDGGYAEHATVAADSVAPLPKDLDPIAFATIGLTGVTAYMGLLQCGSLAGKTLLVTGPKGGVGSAAVLLGRAAGANVIELQRGQTPDAGSADAILDVLGGDGFGALIASLRQRGRYCIVGALAGGDVKFDAWSLLHGLVLTGYSTEDLDGEGLRAATKALLALELPPVTHTVLPLAEASRAHDMLEKREVSGRIVLVP